MKLIGGATKRGPLVEGKVLSSEPWENYRVQGAE